jgi:hypothetical protein
LLALIARRAVPTVAIEVLVAMMMLRRRRRRR